MPFIYGPRIYLRSVELEDWEKGYQWVNDPEVSRYVTTGTAPYSRLQEKQWYERAATSDNEFHFALVVRENDRYIGNAGLFNVEWRTRKACFGIMIGDRYYWNQGFGTEATYLVVRFAFEQLGLHRVWLHVNTENVRAQRAYEKVGFKREGTLRHDSYFDGEFRDLVTMGILQGELVSPTE